MKTNPAVSGPFRIYVEPNPSGVELDVTAYVEALLLHLVRDEADTIADLAELDASAQHAISRGDTDAYVVHERDAEIERLAERLGARLPVYGEQVRRLAERLLIVRVAGQLRSLSQSRPVSQREGGAAA